MRNIVAAFRVAFKAMGVNILCRLTFHVRRNSKSAFHSHTFNVFLCAFAPWRENISHAKAQRRKDQPGEGILKRALNHGRLLEQDFLRLNGCTRDERHDMISRVQRAFTESNASILDFKMFSNLSLNLIFELPARRIGELSAALTATGLRLSAESRELLGDWQKRYEEADDAGASQPTEIAGSLQITFIHHEPDLRLEVPPIPG
jgi:hypothetical protein